MNTCKDCKYFVRVDNACHRYPPMYSEGWATVLDHNWCGEFSPAPEAESGPVCLDCGMPVTNQEDVAYLRHDSWTECITALKAKIASLEGKP